MIFIVSTNGISPAWISSDRYSNSIVLPFLTVYDFYVLILFFEHFTCMQYMLLILIPCPSLQLFLP